MKKLLRKMTGSKKVITVFGATGQQGGSVVDIFLHDPKLKGAWAVRAVTRDVTKDSAKKLAAQGAEVVSADVNDKASLEKAMQGAAAVYAVTNYWEKMDADLEIQQGKNLADAAKAAGVGHFIWSSLLNFKELTHGRLSKVYHFDSKAKVESYVRSLGIPATYFMPGLYMSNFPGQMLSRENESAPWTLSLPASETASRIPLFDAAADSGKFVKAIVLRRESLLGARVFGAVGYVTPKEMLDELRAAFPRDGGSARYVEIPADAFLAAMQGRGMPEYVAEEMLQNWQLLGDVGYYGGAPLEESLALLAPEDKLTTWGEFIRKAPAFKDLK